LKAIVIYKSESGFTKKIAGRIAIELHADIISVKAIKRANLSDYDAVIYGGAVHAQRIIGLKKAKTHLKKLYNKKIVVFAVGSAANDSFSIPIIKNHNLTKQELERIDFFYFRGGYNKDMLTLPSKAVMSIVSSLVFKRIQNKKPEFKEILEMMKNGADYTETEDIFPLVTNVKKFISQPVPVTAKG
jgi:menaquinone-dependent protoporphyrinogen IX oxidase